MIFCAGLGTRFKPFTDRHPKALALINGKTLLQRNIEYLQSYGITNVIVNVHHFADQIIDAIEKNKGWGSHISISDETAEVLETGGGLLHAKPYFKIGQPFITLNADVLTDLNIHQLLAFHQQQKPLISLAVSDRNTSRRLLFDNANRLCGWKNNENGIEKIAVPMKHLSEKSYDCVAVFEYEVFDLNDFEGKFSLIDLYLNLARQHTILGYHHNAEKWMDIGKPEKISFAEKMFL
jgi:NDP-sugar pyrophosphorylase family protein